MSSQENPFLTGRYHQLRARELEHIQGLSTQNWRNLHRLYRYAENLIDEQGWQNPLDSTQPNILLMGLEGHHTARAFIDFVRSRNPSAAITVADFSKHPLIQCKKNGIDDMPNVTLVQADTTALDFPNDSFDMIETDGLLQFLNPQQKRQAITQWFRVLRAGGIMTTHDRFVSITESPQKWDELNDWRRQLKQRLEVYSYPTTLEVIRYLFTQQGFETTFGQVYPNDHYADNMRLIFGLAARKMIAAA